MNFVTCAARSLKHNRLRFLMTVVGGAIAIVIFVALRTIITSWNVVSEHAVSDRLATRHKVSFVLRLHKHYIDVVRDQPGVDAAAYMNWFGARDPVNPNNYFASYAVEPEDYLKVYDELVVPDDQKKGWFANRSGVLVGELLAKRLGLSVGDQVPLEGGLYPGNFKFTVEGIYGAKTRSVDRAAIFAHWSYLNETLPVDERDKIGWVMSRIDDPGKAASVAQTLDQTFDKYDVQTATATERALTMSFLGAGVALLRALNLVAGVMLFIMCLIMANTISMGVRERTQEFAVMRALGFLPKHVKRLVLLEALAIGVCAAVLGLLLAYPFVEMGLGQAIEENIGNLIPEVRIEPQTIVAALLLAPALAIVAAMPSARGASRLVVINALRRVG